MPIFPTLELYRRGDQVRTPTRRLAAIAQLRADDRYDLVYLDLEGGQVALRGALLELVCRAPARRGGG